MLSHNLKLTTINSKIHVKCQSKKKKSNSLSLLNHKNIHEDIIFLLNFEEEYMLLSLGERKTKEK